MDRSSDIRSRSRAPVFVVGCARSGTTLLYDTLMSAGGFAIYLGESNIFNLLAPRFGDLSVRKNRERMLDVWLGSRLFRVSGLERSQLEKRIPDDCHNAGDFLRIVMDELAGQQNARRWAGNAPEEILHLKHIKKTIPEALIIHVIRDGRDVSLSLSEKRYIRPFPWRDRETPEGAALYWEWIVKKGRAAGSLLGDDYMEVRFEELVGNPRAVLQQLSGFLDHDLNYEHIQETAIGTVARPNTSFTRGAQRDFSPVGRWKKHLSTKQLAKIEGLVGGTLSELGYKLAAPGRNGVNRFDRAWNRLIYRQFFELKYLSKINPLVRALRPALTSEQVDQIVVVDDKADPRKWRVARNPGLSLEAIASVPMGHGDISTAVVGRD
jgi:hypothetical protein